MAAVLALSALALSAFRRGFMHAAPAKTARLTTAYCRTVRSILTCVHSQCGSPLLTGLSLRGSCAIWIFGVPCYLSPHPLDTGFIAFTADKEIDCPWKPYVSLYRRYYAPAPTSPAKPLPICHRHEKYAFSEATDMGSVHHGRRDRVGSRVMAPIRTRSTHQVYAAHFSYPGWITRDFAAGST